MILVKQIKTKPEDNPLKCKPMGHPVRYRGFRQPRNLQLTYTWYAAYTIWEKKNKNQHSKQMQAIQTLHINKPKDKLRQNRTFILLDICNQDCILFETVYMVQLSCCYMLFLSFFCWCHVLKTFLPTNKGRGQWNEKGILL